MHRNLDTYLHDHLAAAIGAIELIELLHRRVEEPDVRSVLAWLLLEVKRDEAALQEIAEGLAIGSSTLKTSAAWVSARFVSLKTREAQDAFGSFEGLEVLALGILGKLHLWKALGRSAAFASDAYKPDLETLIRRAEDQHSKVEELRLYLAGIVL